MVADSPAQLLLAARELGVAYERVQYPGTRDEHFDITLAERKDLVTNAHGLQVVEMPNETMYRWVKGRTDDMYQRGQRPSVKLPRWNERAERADQERERR